jgi:hypothetical protein
MAESYEQGAGDGSAVGETKERAGEKASEIQDKARERAQQAKGQARDKVREQVNERSTQAGERIDAAADDARSVALELRRQGKDTPARYAEQAAERAARLGGYLRESDGDTILRDVENFARRNPWAVAAGAFAFGFVASRLLKASSSERHGASVRSLDGADGDRLRSHEAQPAGSVRGYGSASAGRPTPDVSSEPTLSGRS